MGVGNGGLCALFWVPWNGAQPVPGMLFHGEPGTLFDVHLERGECSALVPRLKTARDAPGKQCAASAKFRRETVLD
jgi:hypothetical protein